MKRASTLTALIFALIGTACVNSTNKNKIFADFDPTSKQYKQELARQVTDKNAGDIIYIFNRLLKIDGKDYLDISVSAEDINAQGLVLVSNWSKLENIKRTRGKGYSGAELRGLILEVDNSNAESILIYKDLGEIVD